MPEDLVIATRRSPLALAQAEAIRAMLAARGAHATLLCLTSEGDDRLDAPLPAGGGKGLFVGALEAALSDGRADLAAHSMKDVPGRLPDGLRVITAGARADPRDALVTNGTVVNGTGTFDALPDGASVGTSSLRRTAFLRLARPDLRFAPVRGNVGTRLAKLDGGDFDALVLACAGLDRLGLGQRVTERLSPTLSLPAAGQGALAVEYATERNDLQALLAALTDPATERAVAAERALVDALGVDCAAPLGAHATVHGQSITLRATLAAPDARHTLQVTLTGDDPAALGERAAHALAALGADGLLTGAG